MRPRRCRNFSFTAALSSVRALSGPGQSRMSWNTTARSARHEALRGGQGRAAGASQPPPKGSAASGGFRGRRYLHGRLDLQVELDDLLVAHPHRHGAGRRRRRHLGNGAAGPRAPPAGTAQRPPALPSWRSPPVLQPFSPPVWKRPHGSPGPPTHKHTPRFETVFPPQFLF